MLTFLETWYAQQCDTDWEHQFGVKIETLDNPGWSIEIDIDETSWAGRLAESRRVERSEVDWYDVWCDGLKWYAACGPQNLTEVLELFRHFVGGPVEDNRLRVSPEYPDDEPRLTVPTIRYLPAEPP